MIVCTTIKDTPQSPCRGASLQRKELYSLSVGPRKTTRRRGGIGNYGEAAEGKWKYSDKFAAQNKAENIVAPLLAVNNRRHSLISSLWIAQNICHRRAARPLSPAQAAPHQKYFRNRDRLYNLSLLTSKPLSRGISPAKKVVQSVRGAE